MTIKATHEGKVQPTEGMVAVYWKQLDYTDMIDAADFDAKNYAVYTAEEIEINGVGMKTPAYWAGYNACHDGVALDDNPTPDVGNDVIDWIEGWNDGDKEVRAENANAQVPDGYDGTPSFG